ncbi:TatD family hydrolase [Marinobacter oulmenensis]|uniref:TatD DNase family protein n=1 Tax=Marinobacter oulmenensis TaxID=643747 RepID=A0A840UIU9_9GAMM|nr:TatD family hydrolase [Marinobacter oulmenensis]MBB5322641.1 TatD DNase family protein [Marinobacter oulmenensis]
MTPLVDAHCHFDFPRFADHRGAEWQEARRRGLGAMVIPGVRQHDWDRVSGVANPKNGIWFCLGIHPWFVQEHSPSDLDQLRDRLAQRPQGCLALGECGLDAIRGDLEVQKEWFRAQVRLAAEQDWPLVIHSVRTHDQVHSILRQLNWSGPALVHGFSGSYQQAVKLVDIGCYIGVGGVITHDRARKTRDAIARLPADALVLETDAPDMAPSGVAKGENSPVYLPRIFDALCQLRDTPAETLSEILLANTCRLYRQGPERLVPALT